MKDFLKMIKTHSSTLDEWYAMVRKEIISKNRNPDCRWKEDRSSKGRKAHAGGEGKVQASCKRC